MIVLKVNIIQIIDFSFYPGICEAVLVDAQGKEHHFIEKIPIVTAEDLDLTTIFPVQGGIRGEIVERLDNMLKVSIEKPDHVESVEGISEFWVDKNKIIFSEINLESVGGK